MKLRQKLAVTMAAAMMLTAAPIITSAASTNRVINGAQVIAKGDRTTAQLSIEFRDYQAGKETFFIELTGAKFSKEDYTNLDANGDIVGYSLSFVEDSVAKVNVTQQSNQGNKLIILLPIEATGTGQIKAKLNANGGSASISENEYVIANAAEKTATFAIATGDDVENFYNEGKLSKITLREASVNALRNSGLVLEVELDDTDFVFDEVETRRLMTLKNKYGSINSSLVEFEIDEEDPSRAYVIIPKGAVTGSTLATLELEGLVVKSDEKDLDLGNLTAHIRSVNKDTKDLSANVASKVTNIAGELDKEYSDVVVAVIEKYAATIKMKDEKAVDIVAGRENAVEFTVKENVDDVYVAGRTLTLSLKDNEGATDAQYFMIDNAVINAASNSLKAKDIIDKDNRDIVEKVEYVCHNGDDNTMVTTSAGAAPVGKNVYAEEGVSRVEAIKVTFKDRVKSDGTIDPINKNYKRDSFKVKTNIYVPVGEQDKKTVEIVGELRGEEVKSATAVNVIDPFNITFDTTTLKVGLQDQKLNKFSIAETDKGMFQRGDLKINFVAGKQGGEGITLEDKGDMKVSGGELKRAYLGEETQGNSVEFKRESRSAATLTFDNAAVTVDRKVPEGIYNIELSGDAIDKYDGTYSEDKFLNIGTQNTQDIQETNGLAKVEAVFTIGANTYTVEGVEKTMDATPYIQDGGYTMIPVRYLADALGVKPQNILVNDGVVTIIAGNRTIQLKSGSTTAVVNGVNVEMATKVVMREGRTYVPVGELSRILGVKAVWDNTAKTATFSN